MKTIKIKSTDLASQGPFVIINAADFDPAIHTPYDNASEDALAGAMKSGEIVPSMAELLAARDQLLARERELADRQAVLDDQERANQLEAQRLADEKAALAAGGTGAPDYSTMTKDELQAALTAQGKTFPAAANKADLIALLAAV